jgi:hypothetical protein
MPIIQQLPGALWIAPSSEALPAAPAELGQLFDPFGTAPVVQGFATDQGFANGISHALGGLTSGVRADFKANNPAVHDAVTSLSAILQAAGGIQPGQTMGIATARVVASVVQKVATGVASLASELGGQVSAAVADMGAAIPLIGAYVSMVIDVIEAITYPTVTAAEHEKAKQRWLSSCRDTVARAQPVGTGSLGVVGPADLFRSVLFARTTTSVHVQRVLPPNIAGLIVLLCGDAAVGYGYSVGGWQLDAGKIPGMKIPRPVRQSMWRIVQAIMASVRDPQAFGVVVGDNGRSMMPLLAQILADQYARGNWNTDTARWLLDRRIIGMMARTVRVAGEGMRAGSVSVPMPACSAAGYDIGETLFQFVKGWQVCVIEGACSVQQRSTRPTSAMLSLGRNATRFMLDRTRDDEAPSVAPAALTLIAVAGAIMARRLGL